jgi:hypothetical protein
MKSMYSNGFSTFTGLTLPRLSGCARYGSMAPICPVAQRVGARFEKDVQNPGQPNKR